MGRLFDAAAALLGLRATVTYEGQAAVELCTAAAEPRTVVLSGGISFGQAAVAAARAR